MGECRSDCRRGNMILSKKCTTNHFNPCNARPSNARFVIFCMFTVADAAGAAALRFKRTGFHSYGTHTGRSAVKNKGECRAVGRREINTGNIKSTQHESRFTSNGVLRISPERGSDILAPLPPLIIIMYNCPPAVCLKIANEKSRALLYSDILAPLPPLI